MCTTMQTSSKKKPLQQPTQPPWEGQRKNRAFSRAECWKVWIYSQNMEDCGMVRAGYVECKKSQVKGSIHGHRNYPIENVDSKKHEVFK